MSALSIVLIAVIVLIVLWLVVLGRGTSTANLDSLGLQSQNQIEERKSALEAEDLAQMLAARNARRRARGQEEISADQYEMQVMNEVSEQRRRDEATLEEARSQARGKSDADAEIEELLEATNARRRAKGLPERTRADVEREYGG